MGKASRPTGRQVRRLTWLGCVLVTIATVVVVFAVMFRPTPHPRASPPARTPHPSTVRESPARSASSTAVTWPVAGPVADLSVPLPGMPPVTNPANIYADAGANMLSPAVRGAPYRIYVPDSGGSTVTVINPATLRVTGTYHTGPTPSMSCPATTCARCT